jgi:hypothetical protein
LAEQLSDEYFYMESTTEWRLDEPHPNRATAPFHDGEITGSAYLDSCSIIGRSLFSHVKHFKMWFLRYLYPSCATCICFLRNLNQSWLQLLVSWSIPSAGGARVDFAAPSGYHASTFPSHSISSRRY